MQKILVVLTNTGKIESIGKPTGWFLPELSHVYDVLAPFFELIFASPKGGLSPLDPTSIEMFKEDPSCINFLRYMPSAWHNTVPLHHFHGRAHEFVAIFYPGGHGPVFDLRVDEDSIRIIKEFYEAGKFISSVCHAPIVMSEVYINGVPLVKDREVTGLTDAEEEAAGLTKAVPKLLETDLISKGARFVKADELWQPCVARDGKLITGQNPTSAKPMAKALLKALQEK